MGVDQTQVRGPRMESGSSRGREGVAHKQHRVSWFSRWGCTWLAGVPVTFTFIVRRHLRETGTQSACPQTPSCKSKQFICSLGSDFQLGEIKGKLWFSLYLLFIFALLPHIHFTLRHLPLKESWLDRWHKELSWHVQTLTCADMITPPLESLCLWHPWWAAAAKPSVPMVGFSAAKTGWRKTCSVEA